MSRRERRDLFDGPSLDFSEKLDMVARQILHHFGRLSIVYRGVRSFGEMFGADVCS
jgi:hypothetical protein